ncbi:unknown protein [Seminavis robusta]|uniref:Tyr recombinase domain-containing protein n=1 Tax=Seminavis robusta TaxID=568900 RepID=A0A9N8EH10_9STRA|nr:unknown protein [Seminavis robusta]|eukprot:Sro1179_g249570.1 n/a (112) ;mRNA; f:4613-4948
MQSRHRSAYRKCRSQSVAYSKIIQKFCDQIGVQDAEKVASGHALRAKAGTIMKGLSVDPHAVARHMGHKSIDTQKHYTETTLAIKSTVYNALGHGGIRRVSIDDNDQKPAA